MTSVRSPFATALVLPLLLLSACGGEEGDDTGTPEPSECRDEDQDGFGPYCHRGPDCDDSDPTIHVGCDWCSLSRPETGCPCEGDRLVECYSSDPEVDENGEEICRIGERRCVDGAWSPCEYTDTFPVPDRNGTGGSDEDLEDHRAEMAAPPVRVDAWTSPGCTVCGDTDYECTSWGSWHSDGTFADPVPPGGVATQIRVDLYGVNCAAVTEFRVEVNGTLVQQRIDPAPNACSCNTCGGPTTYTSSIYQDGFPGYVYGGNNTVDVVFVQGLYCLSHVDVRVEYRICGNGILEAPEVCDDGNRVGGDGCEADCMRAGPPAVCGDGAIEGGEECDDGNVRGGDGCDATCEVEQGWDCDGGLVNVTGTGTLDGWTSPGCQVCGDMDYECTSWGTWHPDTTFVDPVPAGETVTQILVDLYGVDCADATEFRVDVNGNLVQQQRDPSPTNCLCGTCGGPSTYRSAVFPGGFPGYVYGGVNRLNVNFVAGLFCLSHAEVRLRYGGLPSVCHETCGDGIVDPGEQCDDGNDDDDDLCRNDCTRPEGPVDCGICDLQCREQGEWLDEDSLDGSNSDGVQWDDDLGGIVLGGGSTVAPYGWPASDSSCTLSKIDQFTGREVARYYTDVAPYWSCSPSRTAMDGYGNAYVGNRGIDNVGGWWGPSGRWATVSKFAGDEVFCRNGAASTSRNSVPLPFGTDDCHLWTARVGTRVGAMVRSVALSAGDIAHPDGYVWVGTTNNVDGGVGTGRVYKLDPDNGATLFSAPLPIQPYGAASDGGVGGRNERVWFSEWATGRLAWVDTVNGSVGGPIAHADPWCGANYIGYGMTVDDRGRVIQAGQGCGDVRIYDSVANQWCYVDTRGNGSAIGVAVDNGRTNGVVTQDPRIWMATISSPTRLLSFLKDEPCVWNGSRWTISGARVSRVIMPAGQSGGMGAGVDFTENARIWVVNRSTSNVSVYNPLTGVSVAYPTTGPLGNYPYTYSDFTGFQFRAFVNPSGYYFREFGDPPACGVGQRPVWGMLTWDADIPDGTHLRFEAATALTADGLARAAWVDMGDAPPAVSPPGIDVGAALVADGEPDNSPYVRIRVVLVSDDGASTPVFRSLNLQWICSDSE